MSEFPEPIPPEDPEPLDPVCEWREQTLHDAGYPEFWAVELAHHPEIDLHLAVELARNGCDPDVAAEILR